MVVKVYISGISASTEIKSYQQRAQFILDSLQVPYESIDITDPGHEEDKDMIKQKCKHRNDQPPRTPQFFNEDNYCGDYFDFEIASDEDRVLEWLGLEERKNDEYEQTQPSESIQGNTSEIPTANEPEVTHKETITYDGDDKIITEETITKEESIIFGDQVIRTAPEYVKVNVEPDSSEPRQQIKETVEFDPGENQVEEETCLLEASSKDNSRCASTEPTKQSDSSENVNSESFEKIDHDEIAKEDNNKEVNKEGNKGDDKGDDKEDNKEDNKEDKENNKLEEKKKKKEDSSGSDVDESLED